MVHILLLFQLILNCMCFIVVGQLLSHVQPFVTPWAAAHQAPCPPLSPKVSLNSHPLSQWCCLTISSSAVPFSFCFQSSQHQGFFFSQWAGSSHQVAKVLELRHQHQSFQWIFRVDLLKNWLVWSLCSPRDSQESSPAPQFKSISSSVLRLLYVPISHLYMTIAKTIALTTWTFLAKWCPCFLIYCLGLS